MKKNIFIICIMLVLNLVSGCKQYNLNTFTSLPDNIPKSDMTNLKGNKTSEDNINSGNNNGKVELKDEIFEQVSDDIDVKVRYPQIVENENIMNKKGNELIKEYAIDKYYEQWNIKGLTLDQSYDVEKNGDGFLSIVFFGYVYVERTAHPTQTCHAVTINLKTGELCNLSNFIYTYEYLENKITDGKYEVLYGGLKKFTSNSEILSFIRSNFEETSIKQNLKKFYITEEGKVCIIMDLPHGGGDYSILCIN